MNFHSAGYAIFLAAVLALFWVLSPHRRLRQLLLLAASYAFYASWEAWYLGLIAFSTVLDFQCGRIIGASSRPRTRRMALLCSLAGNLGVLCFFKYWDWGLQSLSELLSSLGLEVSLPTLGLLVPVGISFYTFQTLSYTIDIYRGTLAPRRSLLDLALFVAFFPQLVAGPIVRAAEFLPQLDLAPRFDRRRLHDGLWFIALGLTKKVLLADVIGRTLVDPVYASPGSWSVVPHLLAMYGFAFQIYGDFAGYSDIAIGSARLFGFDLPENFRTPFQSRSTRELWRRWHITLSSWVRDYIYLPLGGSRVPPWKVFRNMILTMVLLGVWHGASSLWVLFGLLHGLAISLEFHGERRRGGPPAQGMSTSLRGWVTTFHFFALTLLLVRSEDLGQLASVLADFGGESALPSWGLVALGVAALGHFLPERAVARAHAVVLGLPTAAVGLAFGVFVACVALVNIGETPYIYFKF